MIYPSQSSRLYKVNGINYEGINNYIDSRSLHPIKFLTRENPKAGPGIDLVVIFETLIGGPLAYEIPRLT